MSDTQNVICREIFIAAAPEAVFDFFVDPAMMARWIGLSHQLDPRPGGMFRVEIQPRQRCARRLHGSDRATSHRIYLGLGIA